MGVIQFILGMGCILGAGYLFISAYPPPTGDMSHDHLMTSPNALNEDPTYLKQAFEYFMKKYWKVYSTMDEKQERFLIFIENLRFIAKHNMNRGSGHTVGINQFGDMTHLEYSSSFLSPQGKSTGRPEIPETYDPYGADVTIDWVKAGKVTKVMNGGWKCLSDWAIAATGAVESLSAILTKKLVEFSAQQLVDCDGRNNNCAGGSVAAAYDYIKDNGIALATSYPYVGKYETCKVPLPAPAFHIGGKATIAENDNPALILHLKNQPISATIDGYAREFMFYKGGNIYIYIYIIPDNIYRNNPTRMQRDSYGP